jgi:hypothetical protein
MKQLSILVIAGALMLGASTAALANQIDMAKITCGQLMAMPAGATLTVGSWMSGYYNSKANNTVIDFDLMVANADVVSNFCTKNPNLTLMKAIKDLLPK